MQCIARLKFLGWLAKVAGATSKYLSATFQGIFSGISIAFRWSFRVILVIIVIVIIIVVVIIILTIIVVIATFIRIIIFAYTIIIFFIITLIV